MRVPVPIAPIVLFLITSLMLFNGCREEQKNVKGCTDPEALNYDPGALKADSASCEYPKDTSEQIIWSEGEKGSYDGEKFLGAFEISACQGSLDTMTLNASSSDPGPFSMILERNSAGQFGFVVELTNERDLSAYDGGEIRFELLDPDSLRPDFTFQSFVHGHLCNNHHKPCNKKVCTSRYVNLSSSGLNDSTMERISIPIADFADRSLEKVDHVLGIRGKVGAGSDTVLAIRDVRLVP